MRDMGNTRLTCPLFWGAVRSLSSVVPDECSFLAYPVAPKFPKQLQIRLQRLNCLALLRSSHHDFSIIPSFCFAFVF